jgi:hypothetical protein
LYDKRVFCHRALAWKAGWRQWRARVVAIIIITQDERGYRIDSAVLD